MAGRLHVVGIGAEGDSGLSPRAREVVDAAELLIGAERLLAMIPAGRAERLVANPARDEVLRLVEATLDCRRIVVLASGDPGFFGVGKVLAGRLGKERVEIVPHMSSVQLAFARIKESWENAVFLSVHGRPMEGLAAQVRASAKVAILTDGVNTPAAIARVLLDAGIDGYRAYLCEKLGGPGERVREADLAGVPDLEASDPNLLLLLRQTAARAGETGGRGAWCHGIPDEEFFQRRPHRGLITKLEVRMVALAKLGVSDSTVVWDIGAGSGSVAIEAAMIARAGRVYAFERDPEGVELIHLNLAKFGVGNVVVVSGAAPEALTGIPEPEAVFIGGSGGQLAPILDVVGGRLGPGGRVVVNAATLQTADTAMAGLEKRGFVVDITLVQASRGKQVMGLTRFEALNPVFVLAGCRRDVGVDGAG